MGAKRELFSYCILYAAVTLVNKFVLTELGFRYPTIFQGWQTFVGALILLVLHRLGRLDLDLSSVNRAMLVAWLPHLGVYVVALYSGSVALSNMPIPVFLSLHNVTNVLNLITERIVIGGKVLTPKEYLSCSVILVSTLFISQTDTESSETSYLWMLLHVSSSVILVNYSKFFKLIPNIKDCTLLCLCYTFSVFVFLPSTVLLGDYSASLAFPFWRHRKFYCGCVLSGILGAILTLLWFSLKEKTHHICAVPVALSGLGKCAAACLSLLVFPPKSQPHFSYLLWIVTNLVCALTLSDVITQNQDVMKPSLSDPDFNSQPKHLSQQV